MGDFKLDEFIGVWLEADEILHTEQMRMKQMREMKMDLIKSLINYKINHV